MHEKLIQGMQSDTPCSNKSHVLELKITVLVTKRIVNEVCVYLATPEGLVSLYTQDVLKMLLNIFLWAISMATIVRV